MQENTPIKLIVGLGNPGPEYENTRHNVGVWFVEALAKQNNLSFRLEPKFFGRSCNITIEAIDSKLFIPTTFMNHSGRAVKAISNFYRIEPHEILVVHDDLDLPPGSARLKRDGGHGGHNGLRDIMSALNSRDFFRLRLGIGHPGQTKDVVDYVLKKSSRGEQQLIDNAIEESLSVISLVITGNLSQAMNQLHTSKG